MSYFLAIDVGAERTVAAVARAGADEIETVDLGDDPGDAVGVASVLHLGADGVLTVGAAAQRWAATQPERVVSGFPARVGDGGGDPMLLAGEPWAPEELTAWLVRWVVDRVAERAGPAAAVAVIHPGSADADRTRLLAAVAEQDLDVAFVAAPDDDGPPARADGRTGDRAARAVAASLRAAAGYVPAPRSTDSGGYDPRTGGGPSPSGEHAPDGRRREPATTTLDADGFLGGMGATNTAGLLSGYPPPHGVSWPSGQVAVAVPGTAVDGAVDLPAQRSDSGRWHAAAPGGTLTGGTVSGGTVTGGAVIGDAVPAGAVRVGAPAALRARNDPAVLVGAGGLAAAVAVVATLLLWPAPRTTDTAASRPVPVAPVATASVLPTTEPAPTPSVAPTTTVRPRPVPTRVRRPAPPVTEPPSVVATTPPPTESSDPTEPTTAPPASSAPSDEPNDPDDE